MVFIKSTSRIQLRRAAALFWSSTNPVLLRGEPGFETDTYKMKVGDGISRWIDLPYQNGLGVTGDLLNLEDVKITNLENGDVIKYDQPSGKWVNLSLAEAGIASSTDLSDTETNLNSNITTAVAAAVPSGVISQFAGASAPTGYLLCTGQSLSTTTYAALFSAIGYAYGGSGASFNVPNLQGRIPVGVGTVTDINSRTAAFTRGATGGEIDHKLVTANMPSHSHGGSTGGNYAYNTTDIYTSGGSTSFHAHTWNGAFVGGDNSYRDKTYHAHSITAEGGNGYHNNIQPYVVVNYIIKT